MTGAVETAPVVWSCSDCGDKVTVVDEANTAAVLDTNPCGCGAQYDRVGPYGLNVHAIATLKEHGLTAADWVRIAGWQGSWGGDVCGCTDDRCANGFHHMGVDDCRCLEVLIAQHRERPGELL